MEKILIINTGGTFNKRYNPLNGALEVPHDNIALEGILQYFPNLQYELKGLIYKDSLEMLDTDREILAQYILASSFTHIMIVHGTDTMDQTAQFLEKVVADKCIVLSGAMVPVSIDKTEATSNFATSIGYLLNAPKYGVYIGMHGLVEPHQHVFKNRKIGVFQRT
ncbi:asparaginase domain-containing protein [Sulfurospirillum sp. 1612]|uniref:asparaginase domain-containing protein n=1 Tax=Sulfurospirillum sp. 1612 TaxID=3094835 RepID=UPI002F9205A7